MYAISGTRNPNIPRYQVKQLQNVLLQAKKKKSIVGIGDCPTGIDFIAKKFCFENDINFELFRVDGERTQDKLRARTIKMVKNCKWLFSYPNSLNAIGSGTWLATFEACRNNIPVYVCWNLGSLNDLPKIKNIDYWQYTQSRYYVKPKCIYTPKQIEMELGNV